MKKIAIVTVSRSDFGIYKPLISTFKMNPHFNYEIIATGMHLEEKYGNTIDEVIQFDKDHLLKIKLDYNSNNPNGIAQTISDGIKKFSNYLDKSKPDFVILLGDRFEMLAFAISTLPFNVPIIHLHGGEVTEGAIDESIRHSITKMSHLHFASTENYKKRIIQLGEEPWRVHCSGAISLNAVDTFPFINKKDLEKDLNLSFDSSIALVTYHPETLNINNIENNAEIFFSALDKSEQKYIITYPNADTFGDKIINIINKYKNNSNFFIVPHLGKTRYFSVLKYCSFMIGNSSSGIIEAGSFKLPVINVGIRQLGRDCGKNVIHTKHDELEIIKSIEKATSQEFKDELKNMINPYFKEGSTEFIVNTIKNFESKTDLIHKKFYNINWGSNDTFSNT